MRSKSGVTELGLRILHLLNERERKRTDLPTAGEIARALGVAPRLVVVTVRSLEAMGLVEVAQRFGMEDEDIRVCLKPRAYVYLAADLNSDEGSGD